MFIAGASAAMISANSEMLSISLFGGKQDKAYAVSINITCLRHVSSLIASAMNFCCEAAYVRKTSSSKLVVLARNDNRNPGS